MVIILQLLVDIMSQLPQNAVRTHIQKSRHPSLSDTEEENKLTSTRESNGSKYECLFPPINIPGVVLYSEDENEEIHKIVENILRLSIKKRKSEVTRMSS